MHAAIQILSLNAWCCWSLLQIISLNESACVFFIVSSVCMLCVCVCVCDVHPLGNIVKATTLWMRVHVFCLLSLLCVCFVCMCCVYVCKCECVCGMCHPLGNIVKATTQCVHSSSLFDHKDTTPDGHLWKNKNKNPNSHNEPIHRQKWQIFWWPTYPKSACWWYWEWNFVSTIEHNQPRTF